MHLLLQSQALKGPCVALISCRHLLCLLHHCLLSSSLRGGMPPAPPPFSTLEWAYGKAMLVYKFMPKPHPSIPNFELNFSLGSSSIVSFMASGSSRVRPIQEGLDGGLAGGHHSRE